MASIRGVDTVVKLIAITGLVAALLAMGIGILWAFQERVAFQPPAGPWPVAPDTRRVEYAASDGQRLFAYIVGDVRPGQPLLISFHGNADLAVWQIDWAQEIASRRNITVMLAEYRGYMGLDGRPSYRGSQLDAEAAWSFARNKLSVPADRIALFGHSLGTAVATELAARHRPAALLLQSPFTSARDMAGRMIGYQPSDYLWKVMSRLHFDTGSRVKAVDAPVSVSHGEADRLIPSRMGETVYAAARIKGQWLLVPGAAHNDVALVGGEAYWKWLSDALSVIPTE